MRSTIYTGLSIFALIIFVSNIPAIGQTQEVRSAQEAVNKVLDDSGRLFREGLFEFQQNRRAEAGEKFDKSVEVFLFSTLNIQSDQRLQSCYSQILETVYRIEFPSENNLPQIRALSATCGWRWQEEELKIGDAVASMVKPVGSKGVATAVAGSAAIKTGDQQPVEALVGFNTQEFEGSPLDELSKLELTSEGLDVQNNPFAQQQYQYIQYAVANRSLGFSFQVHPMIQQYINYYRGRGRKTMEVGLYRSGMFMSMARRVFREEGSPENEG